MGLENPSLVKNILKQFIHVESEEIMNGWIEDIVDTTSRPILNDIDGTSMYITCKYISIRNSSAIQSLHKSKTQRRQSFFSRKLNKRLDQKFQDDNKHSTSTYAK